MNSPSALTSPMAMRRLESTTRRMVVKLCNFQHMSVFFDFVYFLSKGVAPQLHQPNSINLL
jgi:hypothetical protein